MNNKVGLLGQLFVNKKGARQDKNYILLWRSKVTLSDAGLERLVSFRY